MRSLRNSRIDTEVIGSPLHWIPAAIRCCGLGAALALIRARYDHDPLAESSNLTLITGPSRTGDIELTLTLGVHGPREIHVVLLD